jgi:acetyl-CoA synthetase
MSTGREPLHAPDAARDDSLVGAAAGPGSSAPVGVEAGGTASAPPRPASAAGGTGTGAASGAGLVFDDPFDRPSSDDTDRGWGESSSGAADDDFTRFLNEKPPHHL